MQTLLLEIKKNISSIIFENYNLKIESEKINIEKTNPEHSGHLTVLVFPIAKLVNQNPESICELLGNGLKNQSFITQYDIVKGFLNLHLSTKSWQIILDSSNENFQKKEVENIVIEFCGPNTNKPLHIGHLRNVFLGYSMANILETVGHQVKRVNIYNDRGIAICKSMLTYLKYGKNSTPESENKKSDHFVGDFYVKFNSVLKSQIEEGIARGLTAKEAEKKAPINLENEELLRKWENGDEPTLELWNRMNNWFYNGSNITLNTLGIEFDKAYYESKEYLKGKEIVEAGLKKGVFYKNETGAIAINLTDRGMDEKIVQRADGTSIYITQDLSLINERYKDYKMDRMIYVVADEQNYHFKVLSEICYALQMDFSKSIYHLSYGMVVSKDGSKYKSREGTAADADEIIADAISEAKAQTIATGKSEQYSAEYLDQLSEIIGLGALRFAMLKVSPTKKIPFDAKENVDFQGDTAPFIQYSFVRTRAILNKANIAIETPIEIKIVPNKLEEQEEKLILVLASYSNALLKAADNYDPSELAQYLLLLAKSFNKFYHQCQIINAEESQKEFRLYLSQKTYHTLKACLGLLGIDAPQKM